MHAVVAHENVSRRETSAALLTARHRFWSQPCLNHKMPHADNVLGKKNM